MDLVADVPELRRHRAQTRSQGETVGFVPTMGCLHQGHLSLIEAAREECDRVVCSIYVNPTQFGPGEDFDAYPRQLEADREACQAAGVDVLYTPRDEAIYPPGFSTFVREELLSLPLCGSGRPSHYRGVCTIVTKLLNQVAPDRLYLGQKDAQQALILRRLVRDLDLPVEVRICPIAREPEGLALSSRNKYLSEADRAAALGLSRSLRRIEQVFTDGERRSDALLAAGRETLAEHDGVAVEYLEVVAVETLQPTPRVEDLTLVAVAARVGAARLIDNTVLDGARSRVLSHL